MKIIVVCTNHDSYPTKSGKTGLWLSELTHFYDVMYNRRVLIDIASPHGGKIPVDERSIDLKDEINKKYWEDPRFQAQLNNSLNPEEVFAKDYRLIYFAGGHGAMWDLTDNKTLLELSRDIYENGGIVSGVGHGVCGLLHIKHSDGTRLIEDKYLTGFSNMEETLNSFVSEVPFYLEDEVKKLGGHYTKTIIPFIEYIEMDERLITGQNPHSARKVASKALEELFEK